MTFIDLLELISALGAEAIVLLQRFAAIGAIACGRLLLFRHIACAVLAEVLVQLVRLLLLIGDIKGGKAVFARGIGKLIDCPATAINTKIAPKATNSPGAPIPPARIIQNMPNTAAAT